MLQVKSGQTRHLGLLYERYKKKLFGYFYNMNRDQSLSEDLVQNTFERVLKYKHTYKEENHFMAWLFQIARNVNNDHGRSLKRHRVEEMSTERHDVGKADDLDHKMDMQAHAVMLHKALDRLPEEKKELLVLSKLKELKHKEVAAIVGSTEGGVRTKVHRAMNDLKTVFLQMQKG